MVILYIWTVVAMTGDHWKSTEYDWRPMGEYSTIERCENAAHALNLTVPNRYRCIQSK